MAADKEWSQHTDTITNPSMCELSRFLAEWKNPSVL